MTSLFSIRTSMVITLLRALYFTPYCKITVDNAILNLVQI